MSEKRNWDADDLRKVLVLYYAMQGMSIVQRKSAIKQASRDLGRAEKTVRAALAGFCFLDTDVCSRQVVLQRAVWEEYKHNLVNSDGEGNPSPPTDAIKITTSEREIEFSEILQSDVLYIANQFRVQGNSEVDICNERLRKMRWVDFWYAEKDGSRQGVYVMNTKLINSERSNFWIPLFDAFGTPVGVCGDADLAAVRVLDHTYIFKCKEVKEYCYEYLERSVVCESRPGIGEPYRKKEGSPVIMRVSVEWLRKQFEVVTLPGLRMRDWLVIDNNNNENNTACV